MNDLQSGLKIINDSFKHLLSEGHALRSLHESVNEQAQQLGSCARSLGSCCSLLGNSPAGSGGDRGPTLDVPAHTNINVYVTAPEPKRHAHRVCRGWCRADHPEEEAGAVESNDSIKSTTPCCHQRRCHPWSWTPCGEAAPPRKCCQPMTPHCSPSSEAGCAHSVCRTCGERASSSYACSRPDPDGLASAQPVRARPETCRPDAFGSRPRRPDPGRDCAALSYPMAPDAHWGRIGNSDPAPAREAPACDCSPYRRPSTADVGRPRVSPGCEPCRPVRHPASAWPCRCARSPCWGSAPCAPGCPWAMREPADDLCPSPSEENFCPPAGEYSEEPCVQRWDPSTAAAFARARAVGATAYVTRWDA